MSEITNFTIADLENDPRFQGSNLAHLKTEINKDGDGVFSQAELLGWDIGGYQNPLTGKADADFDGDGTITLEELATALQFKEGKATFDESQVKAAFKAAGLEEPATEPEKQRQINLCRQRNPDGTYNPDGKFDPARVAWMVSKDPLDKLKLLTPNANGLIDINDGGTKIDLETIGISPELAKVLDCVDGEAPGDNLIRMETLERFMRGSPLERANILNEGLKNGADHEPDIKFNLKKEDVQQMLGLSNEQMNYFFAGDEVIDAEKLNKLIAHLDPITSSATRLSWLTEAAGSTGDAKLYTEESVAGLYGPQAAQLLDDLDGNPDGKVRGDLMKQYMEAPTSEAKALFLITPGVGKTPRELSPAQLQAIGIDIPASVLKSMAKDPGKTGPDDRLDSTKLQSYLVSSVFSEGLNEVGQPKDPGTVVKLADLGKLLGLPPEVVTLIDATDIAGNEAFANDGHSTLGAVLALTTGEPKDRLTYLATGPGANRPISKEAAEWILGRPLTPEEFTASKNSDGSIDPQKLLNKVFPGNPGTTNSTTTTSPATTPGVVISGTGSSIRIPVNGPGPGFDNPYLANAGFFGPNAELPSFVAGKTLPKGADLTQAALKEVGYLSYCGDPATVDEFEVALQALGTRGNAAAPTTISTDNLKKLLNITDTNARDHKFTAEELKMLGVTDQAKIDAYLRDPKANPIELDIGKVAKMYGGTPDEKKELLNQYLSSPTTPANTITKVLAQALGLSADDADAVMNATPVNGETKEQAQRKALESKLDAQQPA